MKVRITARMIERALEEDRGERVDLYDHEVPGLQLRISVAGAVAWFLRYRIDGRRRFTRLGAWPAMKPEQARARAREIALVVAQGLDPEGRADDAPATVDDAWERYFASLEARPAAPKTLTTYRNRWRKHVGPALGRLALVRLKRDDVLAMHRKIKATAEADMAARLVAQLYAWCAEPDRGWVRHNPARGFTPKHRPRQRRGIDEAGTQRLGAALRDAVRDPDIYHQRTALLLLLLAFTGARINEWCEGRIEQLGPPRFGADWLPRWLDVPRPKEREPKRLWLGAVAARIALEVVRLAGSSPWLFPSELKPDRPMTEPYPRAREIFGRAGIPWSGFHACRHTLAGVGAALGLSDKQTGSLLGHRSEASTAIYTSIADEARARLAAQTQEEMARRLLGQG